MCDWWCARCAMDVCSRVKSVVCNNVLTLAIIIQISARMDTEPPAGAAIARAQNNEYDDDDNDDGAVDAEFDLAAVIEAPNAVVEDEATDDARSAALAASLEQRRAILMEQQAAADAEAAAAMRAARARQRSALPDFYADHDRGAIDDDDAQTTSATCCDNEHSRTVDLPQGQVPSAASAARTRSVAKSDKFAAAAVRLLLASRDVDVGKLTCMYLFSLSLSLPLYLSLTAGRRC